MANEKKDYTVKAIDHTCSECNHNWLSKIESSYCPLCKSTILEVEKLRS